MEETEEEAKPKVEEEEEEEEIVESDVELEGDTVEPDNDPPQKVRSPKRTNKTSQLFDIFTKSPL